MSAITTAGIRRTLLKKRVNTIHVTYNYEKTTTYRSIGICQHSGFRAKNESPRDIADPLGEPQQNGSRGALQIAEILVKRGFIG